MKRSCQTFGAFAVTLLLLAPPARAQAPEAADPVMGDYEGAWTSESGQKDKVTAQIRALGDGAYDGFILLHREKAAVGALKVASAPRPGGATVTFTVAPATGGGGGDLLPKLEGAAQIQAAALTGSFSGDLGKGRFEAARVLRQSPTLGAKPPKGATVLFDGRASDRWEKFHWKLTDEGAMQVQDGDLYAVDKFSSFALHVEFRAPFMLKARGQARGNSGVYLQSRYEVQVLDSFGLFPLQDNDCSGIYKIQAPALNACLPPLQWQTYDILYQDGNPEKKELPTITVTLNGRRVIERAKVPAALVAQGTGGGESNRGFLKLQNHGDPVQYRNIWVRPIYSVANRPE